MLKYSKKIMKKNTNLLTKNRGTRELSDTKARLKKLEEEK